ncbi:MAG TPA: hypothetical protein VN963_11055 [bacterium]|nr:hypothetical protein [bacterium]
MAKVNMEKIIEELHTEIKRTLEDVVSKAAPDVQTNRELLYREFLKSVGQRIPSWVVVNDDNVSKVCRHCGEK